MKQRENIKKIKIFLLCLSVVFLLSNLVYSQLVSPLYSQLMAENKGSVIQYLQKIRDLPTFQKELKKYKLIYGNTIEEEVLRPDLIRADKIKSLEAALARNSKSRDVLYSLYLLYNDKGDKKTAQNYLDRVKELDPDIVE